jgi:uncharacterized protein involved in exopolysaccharide biosynthesis
MQTTPASPPSSGVISALLVLKRWRKFIVINVLIVTAIAGGVSFLLPRWYMSSSTVLPPKNANPFGALGMTTSSLAKQLSPLRALGTAGATPDMYQYLSILKSRSLLLNVVERFRLWEVYDTDRSMPMEAAATLVTRVDFTVNEEGTLTIIVNDHDPDRALEMTMFFVAMLDSLNRDLSVREARNNRQFIENRVTQNIADLKTAEEALRAFQEKNGVVSMPSETTASTSAVAELYAQKLVKELEVGYLERVVGRDNPQRTAAEMQLSELNKKLQGVPETGMRMYRLYREYMVQQKLFEVLLPLLEQAKIEEQRTIPTLLVLDRAVRAERAHAPSKRIITMVFFVLSLLVSIGVAFFIERIRRMKADNPQQFADISTGWFGRDRSDTLQGGRSTGAQ